MNKMKGLDKLPRVVYTPESQMRTPVTLARSMWRDLKESRELALRLFIRDISAKYRQSLLGIFWAFIPPILAGLVFIILQSKKVVSFGETDIPYPVFALFGTTLWQLFTESINAPLRCVQAAKPMLAKINFPHEALIVSAFYQTLFSLLIKTVVLGGVLLFFQQKIFPGILLAPLAIIMLIILGITIGLLITPIGMLYTDITSALFVFIQFWFFITPVVYPPPQTFPYSLVATVNPVSPILIGARDLATKGVLTNVGPFFLVCGITVLGLMVGWVIYRLALPIIIERMSA